MSLIALALHAEVAFVSLHHIIRIVVVMLLAAPIFSALNWLGARSAPPDTKNV